jgi:hypothetical protein
MLALPQGVAPVRALLADVQRIEKEKARRSMSAKMRMARSKVEVKNGWVGDKVLQGKGEVQGAGPNRCG